MSRLLFATILLIPLPAAAALASESEPSLFELSIEDLMNRHVDTASYLSSSWREQSGIITTYNSQDIEAMGARTLRDVLVRIPGVSLGMDNHNALGLMLRGNWSLEGKILYVFNDIPVNDLIFGTYPIPPYIPAEEIDRVEVLRGPGSARYGNSAQLAVIRIYTKQGGKDGQLAMSSSREASIGSLNQRFSLGAGSSLTLAGSYNRGHWGEGEWLDAVGTKLDVHEIQTSGGNLAMDLDWRGTSLLVYVDHTKMDGVQGFGIYLPAETVRFSQLNAALSHEFSLGEYWKLRPRIGHRQESTWRSERHDADGTNIYDIRAERLEGSLEATNHYEANADVTLGASYELQTGRAEKVVTNDADVTYKYLPPSRKVEYSASALYGTWGFMLQDFGLTFGARAVNHSYAGSSLTPRIALTRSTATWHYKFLHGSAFREPNIEQIDTNRLLANALPSIRPEYTTVEEIEYGLALNSGAYLTTTLFYQVIKDPIIYTPQGFTNNVKSKTRGLEIQYWYRADPYTVQGNLSWTMSNDDQIPLYDVEAKRGQYVGAAARIANIWSSWRTSVPDLRLQLGARYLGPRYANAFDAKLAGGDSLPISQQELKPETTLNSGLSYRITAITGTFMVQNLTDTKQYIPQPYNDISTPFPYGGREIILRLAWNEHAE